MAAPESDQSPLDAHEHDRQLARLKELLKPGDRVLDLGAGVGRVALPLAEHGCTVVALDIEQPLLDELEARARHIGVIDKVDTVTCDFLDRLEGIAKDSMFDAVVCAGHTFTLASDPAQALKLASSLHTLLKPKGLFILDDLAGAFWPDIAQGNWCEGLSEPEEPGEIPQQMVWADDGPVIALREGEAIDEHNWSMTKGDRAMRLWDSGALFFLAAATGFAPPKRDPAHYLCTMTARGKTESEDE